MVWSTRAKYRMLHHGSIQTSDIFACGKNICSTPKLLMSKAFRTRVMMTSKADDTTPVHTVKTIPTSQSNTPSAFKESSSIRVGKIALCVRPNHTQKADLPNHLLVGADLQVRVVS